MQNQDVEYHLSGQSFADDLLVETVKNAAAIPFYRSYWEGRSYNSIKTTEDLNILPLLKKPNALEFLQTFEYTEIPALLSHSSGTETGTITTRCRSLSELKALWQVRDVPLPRDQNGSIPLVMSVDGANHGQTMPTPAARFGLKAVGFDHAVVSHVAQQIMRDYSIPGVSKRVRAIDAPLGFIKLLTFYLLRHNIDPSKIGLELISTYGEYVTPDWSLKLERLWGAAHIDRYATSETVGGARRCRRCGWYNFFPECWPEVVEPFSDEPVNQGVGLLALTELFPFSQLQPMIRFVPGDLVEIRNFDCDGAANQTFRLLGRMDRALISERSGQPFIVLYPAEVASVLDARPELLREETFHTLTLDQHTADVAAPYAELEIEQGCSGPTIVISVVPKFSAVCFPDAAMSLKCDITKALLKTCSGLSDCLNFGSHNLRIDLRADPSNMRGYLAS